MIQKLLKGEFREVAMTYLGMSETGQKELWSAIMTTKGLDIYMFEAQLALYRKELEEVGRKSIIGKTVKEFRTENGKIILIMTDGAEYLFSGIYSDDYDLAVEFEFVDKPTPNVETLSKLVARKLDSN